MANRPSHIQQWRHNRELLGLVPARYPDWLVTVAFYVALHAVDTLLAHDKVERVTTHDARNRVLFQTNKYDRIVRAYHPLYDLSRTVRYLADPARWVPAADVEQQVLKRYLYPIEASVQKLIGEDLGLAPVTIAAAPGTEPA